MRIKSVLVATGLALSGAMIAACGSSGSDDVPMVDMPPPPPPPVIFSEFVKQQFADTADDTDPVAVDETNFSFVDLGEPDAFDDLLSSDP